VIPPGVNANIASQNSLPGSSSGFVFHRITVSSGATLVFKDTDISLAVEEIVVNKDGALLIGKETCRYNSKISITFHGSRATSSLTNTPTLNTTSKGLLNYGRVEMHGKLFYPTWTRLAYTATKLDASSRIYLQDKVNWEVGQEILITTTVYYDCPSFYQKVWCGNNVHQNERRVIKALSMNDATQTYTLSIDKPLDFTHYAGLEYQAEVALLSRNVLLKGSTSAVVDNFGCHTQNIGEASLARYSSVQAESCGQMNVVGRYPFHFHFMKEAPTSYFQYNSVTNSFYRAYTIHGTNSTQVTGNTAFNIMGHAFYLEDGVEENNKLYYNLVAHVHPISTPASGVRNFGVTTDVGAQNFYSSASLLVPADVSASGFYVLNANNEFVGNTASGGFSGFAFPYAPLPLGMFRTSMNYSSNYVPVKRPLKIFLGNTIHSTGFYGGSVRLYPTLLVCA